jgi:predicted O-methyltransferase YrrM
MPTLSKVTIPVIDEIEKIVKDVHGWLPLDQLYTLFQLAFLTADLQDDIVEIGSWCGRSSLVLGMAAKLTGNTQVYCIDLFPEKKDWIQNSDDSYSFKVTIDNKVYSAYHQQTVWKEPFEEQIAPLYEQNHSIFDIFTANIAEHRLNNIISPFKGNSDRFVRSLSNDFKCKLAFIDGDHGYDAVCRDTENLKKLLVPGGWMCFDDAFSTYDGVNHAIEKCIINNTDFDICQQMTRKFFIARKKR